MNPRTAWKRAYSNARRRGATGRELASIICAALEQPSTQATFWGEHGLTALAMQKCLSDARRADRPLFQSLAETVLNQFGTKNPWGNHYEYGSQAWRVADRARQLRDRMAAAGKLVHDAGNWVRGVAA